jgi:hypothetical protein
MDEKARVDVQKTVVGERKKIPNEWHRPRPSKVFLDIRRNSLGSVKLWTLDSK